MTVQHVDLISPRNYKNTIDPKITFDGTSIKILSCEINYDGKKYLLDDDVSIDVVTLDHDRYIKVIFVEDLLTQEMVVVADILNGFDIKNMWKPNPSTHKAIHVILEGNISKNCKNLAECKASNLSVYRVLPEAK